MVRGGIRRGTLAHVCVMDLYGWRQFVDIVVFEGLIDGKLRWVE